MKTVKDYSDGKNVPSSDPAAGDDDLHQPQKLQVDGDCGSTAPPFTIDSDDAANWVVRRIVESRAYADRVQAWAERETRRAQNDEEFFLNQYGRQLQDWLELHIESSRGRRRCADLPAGRVGLRRGPLRIDVVDLTKVVTWCGRNAPDAAGVRIEVSGPPAFEMAKHIACTWTTASVTWSVRRSQLTEHLKTLGEVPDGMEVVDQIDQLYVR